MPLSLLGAFESLSESVLNMDRTPGMSQLASESWHYSFVNPAMSYCGRAVLVY